MHVGSLGWFCDGWWCFLIGRNVEESFLGGGGGGREGI